MLLFFYFESGKDVLIWVILAAVIFAVAALITKAAFVIRNNKKYKENKNGGQDFSFGDDAFDLESKYTDDGCLIMPRGVKYSVGLNGQLQAGVYELRSENADVNVFKVIVNDTEKEFADGDVVILSAGDVVCPTSETLFVKIRED